MSGKKTKKADVTSPATRYLCTLPPRHVVGKVYRRGGRIGSGAQFLRQAEVLRDLGPHDAIVQLLAVLRDDVALPFIVLELAPCGDLQSFLCADAERHTSLETFVKWAAKVNNRANCQL